MLNSKKQINKMGVKKQENKKVEPKQKVFECLACRKRVVATEKPTECGCSQACYVINKQYEVGE